MVEKIKLAPLCSFSYYNSKKVSEEIKATKTGKLKYFLCKI